MNYAPLIQRVLAEANGDLQLTELLGRVDAVNKSIPTLDELNTAYSHLGREPVAPTAYAEALLRHSNGVAESLERSGVSSERQRQILQRYADLAGKHDT